MRGEIRRICKQAGLTAVYVTHDQKEALSIADRLAVMRNGAVEQVGTPAEVYRHPANRFVAGFIGEGNFLDCRVAGVGHGQVRLDTPLGPLTATVVGSAPAAGTNVIACIRPEAIRFDVPTSGAPNTLRGRLLRTVYQGEVAQHELALPAAADGTIEWKAFELNPSAVIDLTGKDRAFWIAPENIIVLM